MGIGVSVFLIALGAILAFAVNVSTSGFDLNAIGVILMIVGAIGLVTTMFIFGGNGFTGRRRIVEDSYIDSDDVLVEPAVGARRRVVRRREDVY